MALVATAAVAHQNGGGDSMPEEFMTDADLELVATCAIFAAVGPSPSSRGITLSG